MCWLSQVEMSDMNGTTVFTLRNVYAEKEDVSGVSRARVAAWAIDYNHLTA